MRPYYDEDGITLYHGDCLADTQWCDADVVVTDPPYGKGWKRSANLARSSRAHPGIPNDHDTSTRDAALALVPTKPAVVFGSFYAPFPANLVQVLVWVKPSDSGVVGSTTGFRRDVEPVFLVGRWPQRTVRYSSAVTSVANSIAAVTSSTGHPHTKPVDLMRYLIATAPEGIVADPFAGSGSTLLAAKHLRRRAIGVELREDYCEVAARRLSQGILDFGGAA